MGSIGNLGITNLAQILSNSGSSVAAAAITSPTVEAGLQNAPTGDLVQLSDQAVQLQEVAGLFGAGATSGSPSLLSALYTPPANTASTLIPSLESSLQPSTSPLTDLLSTALNQSSTARASSQQTGSSSSSNSNSTSDKIAEFVAAMQAQQTEALFGTGAQTGSGTSTLNLIA